MMRQSTTIDYLDDSTPGLQGMSSQRERTSPVWPHRFGNASLTLATDPNRIILFRLMAVIRQAVLVLLVLALDTLR